MIENKNPQEKLLKMLTEIYNQLEELEEVLEHSFTDLRGEHYQQQVNKINAGEIKISNIEGAYIEQTLANKNVLELPQNLNKGLKLELGY